MENQGSKKGKTMFLFFKPNEQISTSSEQLPFKSQRVEIDVNTLEQDPVLRIVVWKHPINQQDEIRRAYIKMGPYQPKLAKYLMTESGR